MGFVILVAMIAIMQSIQHKKVMQKLERIESYVMTLCSSGIAPHQQQEPTATQTTQQKDSK